ncbi:MAG: sporulation protein YqfD [Lachnospiraceae bacterium]
MKQKFRKTYFGKDKVLLSVSELHDGSHEKYRFLNICIKQNILLSEISMESPHEIQCIANHSDLQEIYRIGEKTKVSVRICDSMGFCNYFLQRKSHFAFFFLMVLLLGFLYFSEQFIWRIEIQGNQTISEEELLSFLETQGVLRGKRFDQYDFSSLELLLRANFDRVIWTSVKRDGTTLVVCVKENEFGQTPQVTNLSRYLGTTLVLDEDGTIVSYYVRQGVPLLDETGYAGKGTYLVDGNVPVYDSFSGETAYYEQVVPDASILLETNLNYRCSFRNCIIQSQGGLRFYDRAMMEEQLLADLWNYRNKLELQGIEILDYSYSFQEKDIGNGKYELVLQCNFHVKKEARVHYENISPQEGMDTAS